MSPELAIGDAALGFWKALPQSVRVRPGTVLLGAQNRKVNASRAAQVRAITRPNENKEHLHW